MQQAVIELSGLTKQYSHFTAVKNLTLTVKKGEIFGLLGPNGAGKSTTILMMLGLTEPTAGVVKVCGINSTRYPIEVKRRVGYLPDDVGFYEDLTGLENLIYTGRLNGVPSRQAKARAGELLKLVGLEAAADKKTGAYSRGMRQRLGLADVLMKQPEVIILDEPTLGIDPEGVREFLDLIRRLSREEQMTVLLSSHHLHQVQQVCDRVGLFVKGELLAEGDINSLSMQLFDAEPLLIEAELSSKEEITESLLSGLQEIEGIKEIIPQTHILLIKCTSDVAPAVARTIVSSGASIHQLIQRKYGLDEIYRRYFEGRGSDGASSKSPHQTARILGFQKGN